MYISGSAKSGYQLKVQAHPSLLDEAGHTSVEKGAVIGGRIQ